MYQPQSQIDSPSTLTFVRLRNSNLSVINSQLVRLWYIGYLPKKKWDSIWDNLIRKAGLSIWDPHGICKDTILSNGIDSMLHVKMLLRLYSTLYTTTTLNCLLLNCSEIYESQMLVDSFLQLSLRVDRTGKFWSAGMCPGSGRQFPWHHLHAD